MKSQSIRNLAKLCASADGQHRICRICPSVCVPSCLNERRGRSKPERHRKSSSVFACCRSTQKQTNGSPVQSRGVAAKSLSTHKDVPIKAIMSRVVAVVTQRAFSCVLTEEWLVRCRLLSRFLSIRHVLGNQDRSHFTNYFLLRNQMRPQVPRLSERLVGLPAVRVRWPPGAL